MVKEFLGTKIFITKNYKGMISKLYNVQIKNSTFIYK